MIFIWTLSFSFTFARGFILSGYQVISILAACCIFSSSSFSPLFSLQAYELSTLTGTQVMLLVASETGHVYTFATRKLQPMITSDAGKALIQVAINHRLFAASKYFPSGIKTIFVAFIKTTSPFSRNLCCILAQLKSRVARQIFGSFTTLKECFQL